MILIKYCVCSVRNKRVNYSKYYLKYITKMEAGGGLLEVNTSTTGKVLGLMGGKYRVAIQLFR